ncbi:glutathione S-transferase family protein [Granulosicoccus antarcticus]|uniref:Disulfide-bond oxidoreductase YfcG n=1 Tax=Granulosicoccus antarcticus IMCC3135 TaxID=1192854 RepID=A0A2Z2P0G8_9GAMM|nr:glutathione S-transferase family protein [Granulosicoccus antarcticus]ASJ72944.1 Disulfide-bond oxidoreductase YfcG [Granulosicoccus antarcticus IMCC3135]
MLHRKLFGHPDSGHAFKVRLCLCVAGIEHDYEYVDIFKPRDQRSEQFRKHSRFGEVPVLVEQGKAYVQSNAILLHLARQTGLLGGEDSETLNACAEWLVWEANRIGMCLPQLRVLQKFDADASLEGAAAWLMSRYEQDVNMLETSLQDGRDWMLGGDAPTIADFCLCGYLVFADEAKVTVPPAVQAWLQRIASLDGWQHPYQLLAAPE